MFSHVAGSSCPIGGRRASLGGGRAGASGGGGGGGGGPLAEWRAPADQLEGLAQVGQRRRPRAFRFRLGRRQFEVRVRAADGVRVLRLLLLLACERLQRGRAGKLLLLEGRRELLARVQRRLLLRDWPRVRERCGQQLLAGQRAGLLGRVLHAVLRRLLVLEPEAGVVQALKVGVRVEAQHNGSRALDYERRAEALAARVVEPAAAVAVVGEAVARPACARNQQVIARAVLVANPRACGRNANPVQRPVVVARGEHEPAGVWLALYADGVVHVVEVLAKVEGLDDGRGLREVLQAAHGRVWRELGPQQLVGERRGSLTHRLEARGEGCRVLARKKLAGQLERVRVRVPEGRAGQLCVVAPPVELSVVVALDLGHLQLPAVVAHFLVWLVRGWLALRRWSRVSGCRLRARGEREGHSPGSV